MWPGPDRGAAVFPGPDTGTAVFPGPDRGVTVFPPAPVFAMPIGLDLAGGGVVLVELIPTPLHPLDLSGGGQVDVELAATAGVDLALSGGGVATVNFATPITLDLSGGGDVAVDLTPVGVLDLALSGSGTTDTALTSHSTLGLALTGGGDAAFGTVPTADTDLTLTGGGAVDVAVSSAVEFPLDLSGGGTTGVELAPITFLAGGMDKAGTQNGSSSWTQVTGWGVSPGYPGAVIESNALRVVGTGTATVYGQLTTTGGVIPSIQFRVKRNGTIVLTSTQGGTPQAASMQLDLVDGDLLVFEARCSPPYGTPTIQPTGTYLRYDPL